LKIKEVGFDLALFLIIVLLVCTGIVMIYSSSYFTALDMTNKSGFFLQKQLVALGLGFAMMMFFSQLSYWRLKKVAIPFFIGVIALLMLVLVLPPIKGSSRWINIGIFGIQPSEFAKLSIIILFSSMISDRQGKVQSFSSGILPFIILLLPLNLLVLKQPDLGTASMMTMIAFFLIYIGGANFGQLALVILTFAGGALLVIMNSLYKMKRVVAWLDPFKDASGAGYHIIQSLIAIGSGGFSGLGLAQSKQKFSSLPEQYTDFIFAIICEELGFLGACFVILLYIALLWRGIYIARRAPDLFGFLMAAGITFYVFVQAMTNISVVLNIFPVTGVPLPFISYGGCSLLVTLSSMGILLNISRYSR